MPCNLKFGAKLFDPDAFAATLTRQPDRIFRAGEREGRQKSSGVSFTTNDVDFDALEQQIADTIAFIRENEKELRLLGKLRAELEDSWYRVDFGYDTRMFDENVAVQMDTFPVELLRLLVRIGADLMISQYPPTDDYEAVEGIGKE